MATLAPQVQPSNDPNYIYWSKEIQQPEADKSGQYSWTGAGQALEAGAKGLDLAVKNNISQSLDKDLSPVVDKYTQNLQSYYDNITGNRPADAGQMPQWVGGPTSQDGLPPALQRLPQKLDTLNAQRANGSLSETHFIGQVLQIAKDYRTTYDAPAYKELIDEQTRRITGIRSANEQIKSLLGDINSFTASKDNYTNHVINEVSSSGLPGAADYIQQVRSGQRDITSLQRIYDSWKGPQVQMEMDARKFALKKANREDVGDQAVGPASTYMHSVVHNSINSVFAHNIPDGEGGFKDMTIDQLIDARQTKEGFHPSDQQWLALSQSSQAALMKAGRDIDNWLNKPIGPGSDVTWLSILGPTKAAELKTQNIKYANELHDAISKKDEGYMYDSLQHANAILRDGTRTLIDNPDIARQAQVMHFGQLVGGPNNFAWSQGFIDTYLKDIPGIQKAMKDGLYDVLGQPSKDLRPTTMGPPTVPFSQHVNASVDAAKKAGASTAQIKQLAAGLTEEPMSVLADVRAGKQYQQVGINTGRAIFGDSESLFNFNKSTSSPQFVRDPDGTMRQHFVPKKGTTETFSDWASPEVLHQMHGYGSVMWDMTKNWVDQTGSRLFKDDLGQLNELTSRHQNVSITWDNERQRFTAVPSTYVRQRSPSGFPIGQADAQGPRRAAEEMQSVLDRYTPIFKVWSTVAKEEGEANPNAYILATLRNHGVDLSKIPALANAITSSHMQPEKEQK